MELARVVVTWPNADLGVDSPLRRCVDAGLQVCLRPKTGARSPDQVRELMAGAQAAIVSTDPFDADVLAGLGDLRVIARMGVGIDSIDIDAASAAGIIVTTTPGANHAVVAEHTVAMMLALVRRLPENDASTKRGEWNRAGDLTPGTLAGSTVGIIGMGRIGRVVARLVSTFRANVVYFDPELPDGFELDIPSRRVAFDDLITMSDVISIHTPSTESTRRLLNASAFARMKDGVLIVNTGRGDAIVESALVDALVKGPVAGAALDVFESEPSIPARLRDLPNVICTPHTAALSLDSIRVMMTSAVDSVLSVLGGHVPDTAVNPQIGDRTHARA